MEKREIPQGLMVFQDRDAVVIRRKWEKGAGTTALLVGAMACWPYFLTHQGRSHGGSSWIPAEFLFHVSPLIVSAYFAVCSLVNRTDVILSGDRFRAQSRPMPWWGDRTVSAQEIFGLTVKEGKVREDGAKYCLMYIDRGGKEHEMLRAGKGREQVDFIGQAVADIIGVEFKKPKPGEFEPLRPWMKRVNDWATSAGRAAAKTGKTRLPEGASPLKSKQEIC